MTTYQTHFSEEEHKIILSDEVKETFEQCQKDMMNHTTRLKMPNYFINLTNE